MYRYEMHCHSSVGSLCAVWTPEELVRAFYKAGYAGLVLTEHFVHGNTAVPREWPWEKRMRRYYEGYERACAEAWPLDFDVLFGIEHAYGDGKEVLTYGIDLTFLLENPDLGEISLAEYAARVHAYGGLVVQAHPFRERDYIRPGVPLYPELLDGVEIYNDHNLPEENVRAEAFARQHKLIRISGSDAHGYDEIGHAAMAFSHRIRTNEELVAALRAGEGTLITGSQPELA